MPHFIKLINVFLKIFGIEQTMSNWKTDFEVKFSLEFKHFNGRKEIKNNTLIVEAKSEDEAIEMIINQYDNSVFLKIDEVKKIWSY